jgi:predicted RND superfamily exporter protein
VLNYGAQQASVNNPDLFNTDCSVMPVIAYLSDHRAETLDRVVETSAQFATLHSTPERQFLLAAGSAGIEAATNIVVRKAWVQMLLLVYAAVIALCFVTFRSWRAVVVAVVPLVITSVLCEALMVALGIGVKVATLPVIALGVGIGIDYALYLLSVQLAQQRVGVSLAQAYRSALQFTGKVVVLVGVTLAAGVATWALSPIKFQADMGILLAFMFIWNMVGAVVLIPALSYYLLPSGRTRAALSDPIPA